MKRLLFVLLFAALFLGTAHTDADTGTPPKGSPKPGAIEVIQASVETEESPKGHNALRKFGRGLANILFGIIEVPNQCSKAVAEHGGAAGVSYGLPKGIFRWIGRELTGVYELVTFPVPLPRGYKPIMKPEFPNEDYEI